MNGKVADFVMNDKCPAGTGKFLELMANTLGVGIVELARMPLEGENIARGIVNSITGRAYALLHKHGAKGPLFFTGGLCEVEPFVYLLSEKLGTPVKTNSMARYAGSTGAVLIAMKIR